jgi:hypothetical protein
LNFFTEHGKSEPPLSLDIPVTIDPTLSDAPKLTELPEVPDTNFNAFDTHLTNLSDHVDLLQDQIYGIGSAVGVDNLNDLNWTTTSNPANGEALMELIGTGDGEELKHKKDEDFDCDEFFNQ